jgi:hypothetical protein
MAKIAGVKFIKSPSGKITHATLSMKHHAKYLEDLLDAADMEKARKGDTMSWDDAKKQLLQTVKRRKNEL